MLGTSIDFTQLCAVNQRCRIGITVIVGPMWFDPPGSSSDDWRAGVGDFENGWQLSTCSFGLSYLEVSERTMPRARR